MSPHWKRRWGACCLPNVIADLAFLGGLGHRDAICFAQNRDHCSSEDRSSSWAPLRAGAIFLEINVSEKPGRSVTFRRQSPEKDAPISPRGHFP